MKCNLKLPETTFSQLQVGDCFIVGSSSVYLKTTTVETRSGNVKNTVNLYTGELIHTPDEYKVTPQKDAQVTNK